MYLAAGKISDKPNDDEDDISELYGTMEKSNASSDVSADPSIDFRGAPFITWIYTDHRTKCDFVCVALPIISGSRDINFDLSEDGMKLYINYVWPSMLFNPLKLFKDALDDFNNPITLDDPKIHAFSSRLLELELTEK